VRTQFSDLGLEEMLKATLIIVLIMLFTSVAAASETTYNDLRNLKEFSEKAIEGSGSDLLKGFNAEKTRSSAGKYKADALAALSSVTEQRPMEKSQALQKYGDVETVYFVSMSLGEQSLLRIFEEAGQDRAKNLVVIQGVREGAKLPAGLQPYFRIVQETENPPTFVLDPSLFESFAITSVPAIVKVDKSTSIFEQDGIAKVFGLESSSYLNAQIDKGNLGDLGIKGNIAPIEEPNLIEVMKEKLANVDWEVKKEQALKRFWDNQEYYEMPFATEERVRFVDPTIRVTADIATPDGEVIVKEGAVINPLKQLPFNRVVYIFNPTRKDEVEFVKDAIDSHSITDGKPVLIASQLYRQDGWDKYEDLTDSLNHPVYKLMPDVKSRWSIERTPSVVTADQDKFVVTEYVVNEGREQ
jgi:conjugal transfer pilus assembly protein TraW